MIPRNDVHIHAASHHDADAIARIVPSPTRSGSLRMFRLVRGHRTADVDKTLRGTHAPATVYIDAGLPDHTQSEAITAYVYRYTGRTPHDIHIYGVSETGYCNLLHTVPGTAPAATFPIIATPDAKTTSDIADELGYDRHIHLSDSTPGKIIDALTYPDNGVCVIADTIPHRDQRAIYEAVLKHWRKADRPGAVHLYRTATHTLELLASTGSPSTPGGPAATLTITKPTPAPTTATPKPDIVTDDTTTVYLHISETTGHKLTIPTPAGAIVHNLNRDDLRALRNALGIAQHHGYLD